MKRGCPRMLLVPPSTHTTQPQQPSPARHMHTCMCGAPISLPVPRNKPQMACAPATTALSRRSGLNSRTDAATLTQHGMHSWHGIGNGMQLQRGAVEANCMRTQQQSAHSPSLHAAGHNPTRKQPATQSPGQDSLEPSGRPAQGQHRWSRRKRCSTWRTCIPSTCTTCAGGSSCQTCPACPTNNGHRPPSEAGWPFSLCAWGAAPVPGVRDNPLRHLCPLPHTPGWCCCCRCSCRPGSRIHTSRAARAAAAAAAAAVGAPHSLQEHSAGACRNSSGSCSFKTTQGAGRPSTASQQPARQQQQAGAGLCRSRRGSWRKGCAASWAAAAGGAAAATGAASAR